MISNFNGELEFDGAEAYILRCPLLSSSKDKARLEKVIKEAFAYHTAQYMQLDIAKDKYADAFYVEINFDKPEGKVWFKLRNIPLEERVCVTMHEMSAPSWYGIAKLNWKQRLKALLKGRL